MTDKQSYNSFEAELKKVKEYLTIHTVTSTMCAVALNIYRPSLCRHKRTLEDAGELVVTHNGVCEITGFHADYLSCNPAVIAKAKEGVNV